MPTDLSKFGKPIKLGKDSDSNSLNGMMKNFLSIKNKYKKAIQELVDLTSDHDAARYFCEEDCMYVFPRKSLEQLIDKLNQNPDDNDCIILFQGCRKDDDSKTTAKPNGRPTLIALAYKYDPNKDTLNRISVSNKIDGFEHPGGAPASLIFEPISGTTNSQISPTINAGSVTVLLH